MEEIQEVIKTLLRGRRVLRERGEISIHINCFQFSVAVKVQNLLVFVVEKPHYQTPDTVLLNLMLKPENICIS